MSTFVEIKQDPDLSAEMIGLHKHGRSKLPNTFDILQPAKTPDGRWVTGIDEDAITVKRINDPVLREERRVELRELREELERLTGLDLKATSKFWETYYIKLSEKKALNFDVPSDKITYYVLLANRFAAPELEAKKDPDYINTKYYFHRTETEDSQKVNKARIKDKAFADLYDLYDTPHKLKLIAKYVLGGKVKDSMSNDGVYNLMRTQLNDDKEGTVLRRFTEASGKTIEELQYKLIIDEAIVKHVIRVRENYYQRGNVTYGKTMADVIKFLSSPENANEFASIKEEVEEKRALG